MGYIYYIWASNKKDLNLSPGSGNYIGQGSNDNYSRMLDHLRIAYGVMAGKPYGSEGLIRNMGASDVFFGVYDGPNYGLNPEIFEAMKKEGWKISDNDDQSRLDAAEILHIISHEGDLSSGNIATGGQGNLVWSIDDSSWVERFEKEFNTKQSDYNTSNINEVKIYWFDSKEVSMKKLFNPEQYLVLRAASIAIQKELYKASFLETLVKPYIDNPNSINQKISTKVNNILSKINNNVFKRRVLSSQNKQDLEEIVKTKILDWIKNRIEVASINSILDDIENNLGKIESYVVHGVPGFSRKRISNNHIAYKTNLQLSRNDYVKLIESAKKPKWYNLLMNNITGIPHKNSKDDIEIHNLVGKTVYDIFLVYLKKSIANGEKKPSTTLMQKIREKYPSNCKLEHFNEFYRYAISKYEKDLNRYLYRIEGSFNEELNRYAYTFQPDTYANTWRYYLSEDFVSMIENHFNADEIPSWCW